MDSSLPGKVPDIDKTVSTPPVGEKISEREPKTSFQEYMNAPGAAAPPEASSSSSVSAYKMMQQESSQLPAPTMDSLQDQTKTMSSTLGDVNNQLNTKNLTLNQSQKYLLRNKLSEASDSVRAAAVKSGIDPGPAVTTSTKLNPVSRFLSYVTDSQSQIASIQTKLKEMSADGNSLNAGQMLMIQIKLNKAQQALEYSSTLLGKAVEGLKTLFNVQI